jgi:hypothetical protein
MTASTAEPFVYEDVIVVLATDLARDSHSGRFRDGGSVTGLRSKAA